MKTFQFEPISTGQIRDYCQASGDWNKIHWDEAFAKQAGLPCVIAHGMLSMGLVGRALKEWGYPMESLESYEARFKEKVLPGDVLMAELYEDRLPRLEIRLLNQNGTEILTARAEFRPA